MKVNSPLANLELHIGTIERRGRNLVMTASDESSIPTRVIVSPPDMVRIIATGLKSPSLWGYVLLLPFLLLRSDRPADEGSQTTYKERSSFGALKQTLVGVFEGCGVLAGKGVVFMARIVTFGEIMLRLKTPGHERFFQSPEL